MILFSMDFTLKELFKNTIFQELHAIKLLPPGCRVGGKDTGKCHANVSQHSLQGFGRTVSQIFLQVPTFRKTKHST